MSLGTILLIILIVLLIGGLPTWPYSRGWGWGPGGVLLILLVIVVALMLTGNFNPAWGQDEATVVVEEQTVIDQIGERAIELVALVIAGLAAWLTQKVSQLIKKSLGDIAAKHITAALERAVAAGVASGRDVVSGGVDYLKAQLPEDIKQLKLTEDQLRNLVKAEVAKPSTVTVTPGGILR